MEQVDRRQRKRERSTKVLFPSGKTRFSINGCQVSDNCFMFCPSTLRQAQGDIAFSKFPSTGSLGHPIAIGTG